MSHFVNKTWQVVECSISHSSMGLHTQCFKGKFKGKGHIAFLRLLIKTWWIWFPFCESDVTNTPFFYISLILLLNIPQKILSTCLFLQCGCQYSMTAFHQDLGSLTLNDVRDHYLSKDFWTFNNGHQCLKSENLGSSNNYLMHLRLWS